MLWWLKACPKCRGDCFEDLSGNLCDVKCLQCGRVLTPAERREYRIHGPGRADSYHYARAGQKSRLAA